MYGVTIVEKKNKGSQETVSVIRCECGFALPLVSNLEEMGISIQAHAAAHENSVSNRIKAKNEFSRIEDFLLKQVYKTIKDLPEGYFP
jgi:hypothetical protein